MIEMTAIKTPIAYWALPGEFPIVFDRLLVEEAPAEGLLRIKTDSRAPHAQAAIEQQLQVTLPSPGRSIRVGDLSICWAAPGEWIVRCPMDREQPLIDELAEALQAHLCAVFSIADGRVCLRIEGAAAQDYLAKGCSLDLHPSVFGAGCVATTRFAGLGAMLMCTAPAAYRLYADIGYSAYILEWLQGAAREFRFEHEDRS